MGDLSWLRFAIYLGAVFIAALPQALLKKVAVRLHRSFVKEYLNPQVVFAYGFFFLAVLIDVIAYRKIPPSLDPILEASAYLYMLIFDAVFSGERIMKRRLLTLALILDGIVPSTLST